MLIFMKVGGIPLSMSTCIPKKSKFTNVEKTRIRFVCERFIAIKTIGIIINGNVYRVPSATRLMGKI